VRILIPIALRRMPETRLFSEDANTRVHPGQFMRAVTSRHFCGNRSMLRAV